jgi:hypothetical protein
MPPVQNDGRNPRLGSPDFRAKDVKYSEEFIAMIHIGFLCGL